MKKISGKLVASLFVVPLTVFSFSLKSNAQVYNGETGDNGNRELQIANYLNERKQIIDNWINAIENANNLGNPSLANQYKPVACTNSLLFQADLQKRVISGEIPSDNENLKLLEASIQYLQLNYC
ncbi:hypothetical protein [Nostoc sp. ChiQUE01b]|uniref:hypothetical protein n=1 Tax=Nostoc sp. ChiQUE01b TaxID=3075376 RepID=UPI002AD3A48A|nr:hypothetical protein [Nostoc sp. ChiQUE01b]MDZ8264458.1 hypothetical protein [Nostoc sp. ChiQUE01b]